jgi:hypothetical protein
MTCFGNNTDVNRNRSWNLLSTKHEIRILNEQLKGLSGITEIALLNISS